MKSAVRALSLALAVNAALLLGCLNGSLIHTNTNRPAPTPKPAPTVAAANATDTPNPGELGRAIKNLKTSFTGLAEASGKAIDQINADDERAIGQAAAINIIAQSGGLILEQGLVHYVNAVANHVGLQGKRVVTGKDGIARMNSRRFFVGVVNDDSMNAYALPGGYIILTRGLVENLTSESDLAFVLGHEISHVDNEDGLKALKGTVGGVAFAKELAHFGAPKSTDEETASFQNPAFFAKVVDKIVEISFKLGMGKNDEREADSQGLMYSTAAGYDAQGAQRVLELLATNPAKIRIFASHDGPADRLALLTKQIGGLSSGRLGIGRYDQGCIQRLEAWKHGTASAATVTP